MDWTHPLPLIGLLEWSLNNLPIVIGSSTFLGLALLAYSKGLLGNLNARLDADRYRKLYKESVERETQCQAARSAEITRQAERDAHVRAQMMALQADLDWVNAYAASLRDNSPAPQRPHPTLIPVPMPDSTPETTTSPDSLPTLAKRLFPSPKT